MKKSVNVVFTKEAEVLLDGETGLFEFNHFDYSIFPNVGDTMSLKTAPNKKILKFVCKSRHFDYTISSEQSMTITLDVID